MKKNCKTIALLAVITAFYSCSKLEETLIPTENNVTRSISGNSGVYKQPYREGELILGKKLNNPYTVENMQKAAKTLNSEGLTQLEPLKIRASHYYVKFMPADSTQFEALDADKSLTLYPYPLDYEIVQSGNHYRDPSTPRGGFAYQYAAIRVDYVFPKVPYEIIATLYIPEEDIWFKSEENDDLLDRLLDRAYVQTGNFQDTVKSKNGNAQKKHPYNPAGRIQIYDTRLNQLIGLEGVDMRARRWFTTYHARTDFNGDYEMNDNFKRPCNYSLWFGQEDFAVRPHLIALTAWIDGPKKEGDWDYNIMDGYDRFVGHIFRGAYRYHYGFIDGLQRPIPPFGERNIYLAKNDARSWAGANLIVLPLLKIARFNEHNFEYDSDEIFSTTIHETAHTAHFNHIASTLQYLIISSIIRESWAVGVEWWLTKLEYKNTRGIINYGDPDFSTQVLFPNWHSYQYWNKTDRPEYTSLFINLIDDYNEYNTPHGTAGFGKVNDQVSGYKLADIESGFLKSIYWLNNLDPKLKANKPNGVTDEQIDELLSYY